jgi:hypothetical protein
MKIKLLKVISIIKVEVPCIDNVGSCTYQDVCAMLPLPNNCPPFFKEQGIPCSCKNDLIKSSTRSNSFFFEYFLNFSGPFFQGTYSANGVQIDIDLPTKIPPGEYIIIGNLENETLGHVACLEIQLNVAF